MQLQQENFWNPKDWFDGWSGGFAGTMKGPLNPFLLTTEVLSHFGVSALTGQFLRFPFQAHVE